MPPILLRYLPHILALVAVVGGLWYFSHVRYNAGYNKSQAEVAEQVAKATAETARIEAERVKLAQRIENDLQPKLDVATSRANSLASRLRLYARSRALSGDAGAATDAPGATGEPSHSDPVGEALAAHLGACARDSERLGGWQEWYRAAQALGG